MPGLPGLSVPLQRERRLLSRGNLMSVHQAISSLLINQPKKHA